MSVDVEHLETLMGLPVFTLPAEEDGGTGQLPEPEAVAWRLDCGWEAQFPEVWEAFLAAVPSERVRALVIGPWWGDHEYSGAKPAVDRIVADRDRFPGLRALFLGDVTYEECEMSWLQMCDVTPLLKAFPHLEEFGARGAGGEDDEGNTLALEPLRHESLRTLRFESGGLAAGIVRAVGASELPALEHLELWLGVPYYGGDSTLADLEPLLSGGRLPALRHLGLQNSEAQDEIAAAVAGAPVVAQLESLSLSMGVLGDAGAEALLQGQPLTHLKRLDLRHNYLGEAMRKRLDEALGRHGVDVDTSGRGRSSVHGGQEHRYVAVSE